MGITNDLLRGVSGVPPRVATIGARTPPVYRKQTNWRVRSISRIHQWRSVNSACRTSGVGVFLTVFLHQGKGF
jgi:hypothetical protein